MLPYVVRIVSLERKAGKTTIGAALVKELVLRGVKVAVMKHAHSRLDVDKDTGRYLGSGADAIVAVGPSGNAVYLRGFYDDLRSATALLPRNYGIVIAEGFKKSNLGDILAVVSDLSELDELKEEATGNVVAAVMMKPKQHEVRGGNDVRIFRPSDISELAEFIIDNAVKFILSQTPRLDCKHCGYSSCLEFSKAYVYGEAVSCPVVDDVKLIVNGRPVHLSPFVKKVIRNTLLGLITSLKEVPKDASSIKELELMIRSGGGEVAEK